MRRNTQKSDEKLMLQVKLGQLNCAAELFERYHIKLYNFFLYQGIPISAAEDLVQLVFERLIRYRKTYLDKMSFRSWLYQIARNQKVDYFKKKSLKISDFQKVEQVEIVDDFEAALDKEAQFQHLEKST